MAAILGALTTTRSFATWREAVDYVDEQIRNEES